MSCITLPTQAQAMNRELARLRLTQLFAQTVSADMVCWAAGSLPSSKAGKRPMQLPFPTNDKGITCTEPTLRVPSHSNVFALGDISTMNTPHGAQLPPTAQVSSYGMLPITAVPQRWVALAHMVN